MTTARKKRKVVVTQEIKCEIDFGDLPDGLVQEIVSQLSDGTFESCWSLGDVTDVEYVTTDVTID